MDGFFLIEITVRVRQIAVSEGRTGDVDRDAPRQKAARYLRNAKEKCGRREPRTSKMQQARTTHSQAVEKVLIKKGRNVVASLATVGHIHVLDSL